MMANITVARTPHPLANICLFYINCIRVKVMRDIVPFVFSPLARFQSLVSLIYRGSYHELIFFFLCQFSVSNLPRTATVCLAFIFPFFLLLIVTPCPTEVIVSTCCFLPLR